MNTNNAISKIEFFLSILGAVGSACAALTQLSAVVSPGAYEILKGVTAGAALASLAAIISIFIGGRHPAVGFTLRFAAAFVLMFFFWVVSGFGKLLALVATIALLLGACLLLMRHLKETENRGISRM